MAEVWETTNFDCLKFVNVSDQETKNEIKSKWIEIREADQRQIEWLFKRNIFPKKNELKDLVNVMCDHDLLVGNTSKCNQEKIEVGMAWLLPLIWQQKQIEHWLIRTLAYIKTLI